MLSENNVPNRLNNEKSPYLLQHAHNPVNWYPWGDEAFVEAIRRDVPVFLSIGYSSCHWCHVMERECFEDAEAASFLNEHFVSVKVDREERPDVDHFYMEACVALTGSGGWPLSCFVGHDRIPFYAGTYFPKLDGRGLPGFLTVLDSITTLWNSDRQKLGKASKALVDHMAAQRGDSRQRQTKGDFSELAYKQFEGTFDMRNGGFGKAPKFPSAHNLLFLLRYGLLQKDSQAHRMVKETLATMAAGGIFDHIGGGFCRYSTDSQWLVPHFEKMLYDNAMLTMAYAEASAAFADSSFAAIARRIIAYCERELLGPHGGFFTAQDADSEGEEGLSYLWTPDEITDVLGSAEGVRFCALFGITRQGNFEGKSIPNLIGRELSAEDRAFAEGCFGRLLERRQTRPQPFKDDKVLASSNGLMIAALAEAGRLLRMPKAVTLAENAARFVLGQLTRGGRFMSSWREGDAPHPATSDDYAHFIWGLLELHQTTHQPEWLLLAKDWTDRMLELFWDKEHGGLFLTGSDVTGLPLRQKNSTDGALPGGNSVAALNLLRLSRLTGKEEYEERSNAICESLAPELSAWPTGLSMLLCSELYRRNLGTEVVVAAGKGMEEMLRPTEAFLPFTVVSVRGAGYEDMNRLASEFEPMEAKFEAATAYLCSKGACQQPITDPKVLKEKLSGVF